MDQKPGCPPGAYLLISSGRKEDGSFENVMEHAHFCLLTAVLWSQACENYAEGSVREDMTGAQAFKNEGETVLEIGKKKHIKESL